MMKKIIILLVCIITPSISCKKSTLNGSIKSSFVETSQSELLYFDNDNIPDKAEIKATNNNEYSGFSLLIYLSTLKKTIEIPVYNILTKICGITAKKEIENNGNITTKNNEDCKKIQIEMGSGEECIIKNSSIKKVYKDLIKNRKVDDSNLLLSQLPNTDKEIKIDNNGVISIEYKVETKKIEISMLYDGGLTEILLEQEGKNIKRSIIYNAD